MTLAHIVVNMFEDIKQRRSIRKFTGEEIDRNLLNEILLTAPQAPSARNNQLRRYTVLTGKSKIEELYTSIAKVLERENYSFFNASAAVIVSVPKDYEFGDLDGACALENLMLASSIANLGSVWINQLRDICDNTHIRKLLNSYEIPQDHRVVGICAIGVPEKENKSIKNSKEVIHWVK